MRADPEQLSECVFVFSCFLVCRSFDRAVEEWRRFHCDMNDLSQWLCDTEQALAEETGPGGDPEHIHTRQEVGKRVKGQNWELQDFMCLYRLFRMF